MEVVFKNMLHAYSGKCDGLVYYYNRRLNKVIARRLPVTKPHAGNARLSAISANLKALNPSEAYRTDMKLYTELLRMQEGAKGNSFYSWSNVFRKLMFGMAKKYSLDLATLTRAQIYDDKLPCRSVQAAVEDGLLVGVKGWERFASEM
ncbi:MAG: hypothetical protein CVU50_08275 [Candidatus Cloacimonetes bacterium HGW-Cloacimonetes-3]|jgi:hypothetical protein|nr:MAG: hypothetical protein CVU50_08275 [Candidatus Cloacimonetes bacterium HGW-Cloacimonetes-3]